MSSSETSTHPRFSKDDAARFVRELYDLEARARRLPSYADQNFRLETPEGRELVLKISSADESPEVLDFQHRALDLLADTFDAGAVPRLVPTKDGDTLHRVPGEGGQEYFLRVLTFLPGPFLADVTPHTPELLQSLGTFLGQLDRALTGFTHEAMDRHLRWDLRHAAETIRDHAPAIRAGDDRALVEHFLAEFENRVGALQGELRRGVIHNDANDMNVLVGHTPSGGQRVTGLIDFGDLVSTYLVAEVSIAATYAMLGKAEPLAAAAEVVGGYHAAFPLTDPEIVVLFDLICARLATSVSIAADEARKHPENDYSQVSAAPAWKLLRELVFLSRGLAYDTFRKACRLEVPTPSAEGILPGEGLSKGEILERRRRYLGRSLSISYQEPLKIVRGFMQHLYDEKGRAYLDGVNNVAHVGHCHPAVVRAGQDQMAVLNTNTRYLHDLLVGYAERLAGTLPDPLEVCFFVNSGSEANDLALRLARAHTGGTDAIVVEGAYHGHTASLIGLSPYKYDGPGGAGRPPGAHEVPMPDVYRGAHRGEDAGARYAEDVARAIAAVIAEADANDDRRVAAFFCESMLGCGGQIVLPDGYLEAAFAHVREAGGVCVADEVQTGFGRAGSHFWAFELSGVVPDIVTLGKPIGNGHPMAAVVTTRAIAASFANGMEYFNTFGGNPVSCAIGLAVLDAIADDALQENAARVGGHLLLALKRLAKKHPLIGDVRGQGLFLGVELVRDRETLEPAADEASLAVEKMKQAGILLSTDGPLHNVIKIKPPLVFSMSDADRLAEALDGVLGEIGT